MGIIIETQFRIKIERIDYAHTSNQHVADTSVITLEEEEYEPIGDAIEKYVKKRIKEK